MWASLVAQMVNNLHAMWETQGSIPGSGRSPAEGNGSPLQHFCLENPLNRGASWTMVHGVAKSQIQLSE